MPSEKDIVVEAREEIAQCERLVPCRYCGAPKGIACDRMYKGRQGSKDRPHSVRRLDAIREGRDLYEEDHHANF